MNFIHQFFIAFNLDLRADILKMAFLFFLLPVLSSAQDKSSFDFISGVDFSNRYTITTGQSLGSIFNLGFGTSQRGGLGSRIGLGISHHIEDDLYIEMALLAFNPRFKSYNNREEAVFNHKFFFVEFPFSIRYEYNRKKLSPYVKIGAIPSLFLSYRFNRLSETTGNAGFTIPNYEETKKFFLSVMIGGGLNYALNSGNELFFELNFRYALTGIEYTNNEDADHLYNLGFGFGMRSMFYVE